MKGYYPQFSGFSFPVSHQMEYNINFERKETAAMKTDRAKVTASFQKYAEHYNLSDVKVKLKYDHTFRVAQNAERIAKSLSLSPDDIDLAWLLGMLHDIGRFEQVRRYGTFQDKSSVNHAALSADILFHDDLIRSFCEDSSEDRLIEKSIRLHNVYRLPSLPDREYLFCTILRDADKVDILRVNCETPRTEIYDLPEEAFRTSSVTPAVYEDIMNERNVDRTNSTTGIDFILGHISFVYGLVWPESLRMVREQGFLEQLLSFQSDNPDTRQKMDLIREKIHGFIDRRIGSDRKNHFPGAEKGYFETSEQMHHHFDHDHFAVENGITIDSFGKKTAVCSVHLTDHHRNAMGRVMGGVVFTLADYVFAIAASSVHVPTVTQQVSVSFLTSPKGDHLTARADCVRDGRTSAVYNVDVFDGSGNLTAKLLITGAKI